MAGTSLGMPLDPYSSGYAAGDVPVHYEAGATVTYAAAGVSGRVLGLMLANQHGTVPLDFDLTDGDDSVFCKVAVQPRSTLNMVPFYFSNGFKVDTASTSQFISISLEVF